jgi:predicted permease
MLRRHRGFTVVAALSLAVGIGLNTTIFSIVNAVLLRETPVAEPERLVEIYSSVSKDFAYMTNSYPDYLDIQAGADVFTDVAAHALVRGIFSNQGRSELVVGEAATANYFESLGIQPVLGRGFLAEENVTEGTHPVVVLGHGLWQRRFGGREDVLGETVRLSDVTYTVVGIAPPGFSGMMPGIQAEFWVPTMMVAKLRFTGMQSVTDSIGETRIERRGQRWLFIKGRLAEGRTVDEAQAQLEIIFARLRSEHPESNEDVVPSVLAGSSIRFHPLVDRYIKAASAGLLIAVALVLTIACANVANMLLARSAARRREFAVRAAIGAGRGRLLRQLLSESLVLAILGGGLGVAIAYWAGGVLTRLQTDSLPIPLLFRYDVDGTVLAYAVGASIATALLFGLAPAWSASRPDLVPALKSDASAESPAGRWSFRNLLVVTQLATSLVLLIAGALLMRGLLAAQNTDLGFDPTHVSSIAFDLGMNGYDVDQATAFRDRVVDHVGNRRGVEAVSLASRLPLAPDINMDGVRIRGHHTADDDAVPIDAVAVGPDYFDVVGVPIVEGRAFTPADREGAPFVVIINETMAQTYWPGQSPIGEQIYKSEYDDPPYEVVGVSQDHKVRSVGETPRAYMHLPSLQSPTSLVSLVVRTTSPATPALPMLRQAILELNPEIVFTEDAAAEDVVATTVAPTRLGAAFLAAFGALALLLAAIGLYGVISYSVSRRTREVGVRMALGARPGDVVGLIFGQGLKIALVGVSIGAVLAAVVAQALESMLYGVSTIDPIAYGAAGLVLLSVAAAANVVPAYRAVHTDPLRALRQD